MGKRLSKDLSGQCAWFWLTVILGIFFAAGGIAGTVFAFACSEQGMREVEHYLVGYLQIVSAGILERNTWLLVWNYAQVGLIIFFLGLVSFGLVGIPFVFLFRGFLFSFFCCCFIRVFGVVGILPSAVLAFFPAVFWFPAFSLIALRGLHRFCSVGSVDKTREWQGSVLAVVLLLMCGIIEYSLIPPLLKGVAEFIL